MTDSPRAETKKFDTEVNQLLRLMINALYSNREIFLRELISNASDACDKLRFMALTDDQLKGLDEGLRIEVRVDDEAGTLSVSDSGIGMSREEVVDNLGTIARSGTRQFLENLSGDRQRDASLIGQFGVGFYAAFIVSDRVVVETRRAGEPPETGVRWQSEGHDEYQLEPVSLDRTGTSVTLHLASDHRDLLNAHRIEAIIRRYSNHIAFPIHLVAGDENRVVNDTQALWARPRAELQDSDYESFFTSLTGDPGKPLSWAHHHVEGSQRYSLLLYLPGQAPFDLLYNRDELSGLKLYIQRVFIMDAAEQLLPRYLRFLRGVVDAADLPLNVSREMLQDSPLLHRIRGTVTARGLKLVEKLANEGGQPWEQFWKQFGSVLKEGVIEDAEHREKLAGLLRFHSTSEEGSSSPRVSLDDYIARMPEEEEHIWYLTADSLAAARSSPHLEAFAAAGREVLLLDERIDEWLVGHLPEYKGKTLKSATRGPEAEDKTADHDEDSLKLAGRIKASLGERVGNVRPSRRLHRWPSCVVAEEQGVSVQMQKLLRQAGHELPESKPDLEFNPTHELLALMTMESDQERFDDLAALLFEQALLAEGGELADPAAYVRRVNDLLVRLLGSQPPDSPQ